jgi:phage terminase large subunit GpA-like protein
MQNQIKARAYKPDPTITYADWARSYFYLEPGSRTPGKIDLSYTPYLIEPLECMSWTSPVQEEFDMKGIQLGWSTMNEIIVGGTVDYFLYPLIMYFGSDQMAMEYVKIRIEPSLENNPRLKGRVKDALDKKRNNTIGLKVVNGVALKFCGGKTEKAYRSFSAATVIFDDIDGFDRDIAGTEKRKGQGSPIDLGRNRTNARQGKYKLLVQGSPTDQETSLIYNNYKDTDKRMYHVVCPFCNHSQVIDFFRIHPESKKKNALHGLECESCNKFIPESKKHSIMQQKNGAGWKATAETENPFVIGRQISSAYSLLGYSWKQMVQDFKKAAHAKDIGNIEPLITFWNTKLGLPWEDQSGSKKQIKHSALYKAREDYQDVPANAAVITAGIDVQNNRIEVTVVANTEDEQRFFLEHYIIGGDPSIKYGLEGSVWNKLEEFLGKTYTNEWKTEQPILFSCLDMGYQSIQGSPFLTAMAEKGVPVVGVFGSSSKSKKKMFFSEPKENKYGVLQSEINVDMGKTLTHNQLKDMLDQNKQSMIHFNKHPSFTEEFFRQLTVEKWSDKLLCWVCPEHARNEATDTSNYALSAIKIFGEHGIKWKEFREWNKKGCKSLISSGKTFQTISAGVSA